MYFVYILKTSQNTLYTGYTNNLERRIEIHKSGKGAKYMRKYKIFKLVHCESFETKNEAMKREYQIKQMSKTQKEKLLNMSDKIGESRD